MKGTLKDKENEIRYILQEEKQKMEKRATGYLVKKVAEKGPTTLYQGMHKPTYQYGRSDKKF
jgi:hypothetical protein